MDTNTYTGKIKRTRKRWRHYKRQLIKAGLNPEYVVATYRIWFFTEHAYKEINLGPIPVGLDFASGIDVTTYS